MDRSKSSAPHLKMGRHLVFNSNSILIIKLYIAGEVRILGMWHACFSSPTPFFVFGTLHHSLNSCPANGHDYFCICLRQEIWGCVCCTISAFPSDVPVPRPLTNDQLTESLESGSGERLLHSDQSLIQSEALSHFQGLLSWAIH